MKLTSAPDHLDFDYLTNGDTRHLIEVVGYSFWKAYKNGEEIPEAFHDLLAEYQLLEDEQRHRWPPFAAGLTTRLDGPADPPEDPDARGAS